LILQQYLNHPLLLVVLDVLLQQPLVERASARGSQGLDGDGAQIEEATQTQKQIPREKEEA
jgi:hypothetical protein